MGGFEFFEALTEVLVRLRLRGKFIDVAETVVDVVESEFWLHEWD